MKELSAPLLMIVWFIFVAGMLVFVTKKRSAAMKLAAEAAGITDIRTVFMGGIAGSWHGYSVIFKIRGGGKDGPERAVVEIVAATPARLVIHKRLTFDINLFGPPLVQTALDAELVVRSDDIMLAQRLLGDTKILTDLRPAILERRDELELNTSRVRVTRVTRSTSRDEALRVAFQLAGTVVERLGLPPAG